MQQLAEFLDRRGQHVTRSAAIPPSEPPPPPMAPSPPQPGHDARKIYLAKPASDMREYYSRLVQELSRTAHAIVPDPDTRRSSRPYPPPSFIDAALREADLSIHLLGAGEGSHPRRISSNQSSRCNGVRPRQGWEPRRRRPVSNEPASDASFGPRKSLTDPTPPQAPTERPLTAVPAAQIERRSKTACPSTR